MDLDTPQVPGAGAYQLGAVRPAISTTDCGYRAGAAIIREDNLRHLAAGTCRNRIKLQRAAIARRKRHQFARLEPAARLRIKRRIRPVVDYQVAGPRIQHQRRRDAGNPGYLGGCLGDGGHHLGRHRGTPYAARCASAAESVSNVVTSPVSFGAGRPRQPALVVHGPSAGGRRRLTRAHRATRNASSERARGGPKHDAAGPVILRGGGPNFSQSCPLLLRRNQKAAVVTEQHSWPDRYPSRLDEAG